MDPFSAAVSLVSLIRQIHVGLSRLRQSYQAADPRITELCEELNRLTEFLKAIRSRLEACRGHAQHVIDEDVWEVSRAQMAHCETMLHALQALVHKIKTSSKVRGSVAWKTRVAVNLQVHGDELAKHRQSISQSNTALQTILHMVTLSISLNNDHTQQAILGNLVQLQSAIKDIRRATAARTTEGTSNSRGLGTLLEAAERLYSAASSTVETSASEIGESSRQAGADGDELSNASFPSTTHRLVQRFVSEQAAIVELPTPSQVSALTPSSAASILRRQHRVGPSTNIRSIDGIGTNDEFETIYQSGSRDNAIECIKCGRYDKALQFLDRVIQTPHRQTGDTHRQLQTLVALCHFLQGSWRQARPAVMALAHSGVDMTVCHFLHGLALGYLSVFSFDLALGMCKQALNGKKKLCERRHGAEEREYNLTLALCAEIYRIKADLVGEATIRSQLPQDFPYTHPKSPASFIQLETDVLQTALGVDAVAELDGSVNSRKDLRPLMTGAFQLKSSALMRKLEEDEAVSKRFDRDTDKEQTSLVHSPNDADDEASPHSASLPSSLRQHLGRLFKYGWYRDRKTGNQPLMEPPTPLLTPPSPLISLDDHSSDSSGIALPGWLTRKRPFQLARPAYRLRRRPPAADGWWSSADKSTFVLHSMHRVPQPDPAVASEQPLPEEEVQHLKEPPLGGYYAPAVVDEDWLVNHEGNINLPWDPSPLPPTRTGSLREDDLISPILSPLGGFSAMVSDGGTVAPLDYLLLDDRRWYHEAAGNPVSEIPDTSRAELSSELSSPVKDSFARHTPVPLSLNRMIPWHDWEHEPSMEPSPCSSGPCSSGPVSPRGKPPLSISTGQSPVPPPPCTDSPTLPPCLWDARRITPTPSPLPGTLPSPVIVKVQRVLGRSKSAKMASTSVPVSISAEMRTLLKDMSATMRFMNSHDGADNLKLKVFVFDTVIPRLLSLGSDQGAGALSSIKTQIEPSVIRLKYAQSMRKSTDKDARYSDINSFDRQSTSSSAPTSASLSRPDEVVVRRTLSLSWGSASTVVARPFDPRLPIGLPLFPRTFQKHLSDTLALEASPAVQPKPKVKSQPKQPLAIDTSQVTGRTGEVARVSLGKEGAGVAEAISGSRTGSRSAVDAPKVEAYSPIVTMKSAPAKAKGWTYWTELVESLTTSYY